MLLERFAAFKNAPENGEVSRIRDLLTDNSRLFIDRELLILLTPAETSQVLGIPLKRHDDGDSILGDLITREQIREWSNVPGYEIIGDQRISLLSVFECMVKCDKGIVMSPGKFPQDKNQVSLQKDVLRRILVQVPGWKERVALPDGNNFL